MTWRSSIALLLVLALPSVGRAQGTATLAGTVVSTDTGEPLPAANVFIAESMIGTATDAEGRFLLGGVPTGAHRLHVSMLGYGAASRGVLLKANHTYHLTFRLRPTVLDVEGVTVTAERDEDWQKHLDKFLRLFVGRSAFADSVRLLNSEVLRFDPTWWGQLRTAAAGPLVFVNRALGYRMQYFLEEFEGTSSHVKWKGEPLFEALTPHDPAEAERWRKNRRRAYYGSFRHFLRALLRDRVREEGFLVYRVPNPEMMTWPGFGRPPRVNPHRYLSASPDSVHLLDFPGALKIIYTREEETASYLRVRHLRRGPRSQRSWIEVTDPPATVSRFGDIVEPYAVTVYGYFAFERLAALLPKTYRPDR